MSSDKAAEGFQQNSTPIRERGKQFVQNEVKPCKGDVILDLGCGTGAVSAYLAELVGQEGKVLGVDPDKERLKVAQESYKGIKNLSFVEGSTSNFPGMDSGTYDIIYSYGVLHWVQNKEEAFKNMFRGLKPAGKITALYIEHLPTFFARGFRELNAENLDRLLNMFKFESMAEIERICAAAGFSILKSCHIEGPHFEFESADHLRSFLWSATHGVFDRQLATETRLARLYDLYSTEGSGEIECPPEENDLFSVLIAVKPDKA